MAHSTSLLVAFSFKANSALPLSPVRLRCQGSLPRLFWLFFPFSGVFGALMRLPFKRTRLFDAPGSYAKMYGRFAFLPLLVNAFNRDFGVGQTSPIDATVK